MTDKEIALELAKIALTQTLVNQDDDKKSSHTADTYNKILKQIRDAQSQDGNTQ